MNENQNMTPNEFQQPNNNKKGMAIAALVLGIVSIVISCYLYVSIPCGIIAIVLGALSKKEKANKGLATAGLVTGCIGIGLAILYITVLAALIGSIISSAPQF